MFWQFTVKNYKTFKDEATLSLVASNYDKKRSKLRIFIRMRCSIKESSKVLLCMEQMQVVRVPLLTRLLFMRLFVLRSAGRQQGDSIEVDPFRLNVTTENEPSEFEVIFSFDHILYRYGFEATQQEVISEWLYYKPKTKEVELFYRDGDRIDFHESLFSKGKNGSNAGIGKEECFACISVRSIQRRTGNYCDQLV